MPCYHPFEAWRTASGKISLAKELADGDRLRIPCGGCLGCRTSTAQMWALRCHLELNDHPSAVFTTLTYDDANLPRTLDKQHIQKFIRRLRKKSDTAIRYFAAGEYGEQTHRPHYHAILYGCSEQERERIARAWPHGFTTTTQVTPARIAYTAGYCQKKIGWRANENEERVDYRTGEVYQWQAPFRLMSRNPGIGGNARKYTDSWRSYAIDNGTHVPVPPYLHAAWKEQASDDEMAELQMERAQERINKDTSTARIKAAEQIAIARHQMRAEKRSL